MIRLTIVSLGIVILLAIAFFAYRHYSSGRDPFLTFAKCLKSQGVKYYGSSYCDVCQEQENLFGTGVSALPFVECLTPDGQSQSTACRKQDIEYYPTWTFKDGSQLEGEQTLAQLAEKSGCPLPQ